MRDNADHGLYHADGWTYTHHQPATPPTTCSSAAATNQGGSMHRW